MQINIRRFDEKLGDGYRGVRGRSFAILGPEFRLPPGHWEEVPLNQPTIPNHMLALLKTNGYVPIL